MTRLLSAVAAVALSSSVCWAEKPAPAYKTTQLSDQFYCEGAYFGDFNKDGKLDIVSGPYWYAGPDFKTKHEVYSPKPFNPVEYSDNFLTFAGDFNADGWTDILYVGFPAKETYWHENPAGKAGPWKKHLAHASVGGESPVWGDVTGDNKPELIFVSDGCIGYAAPDSANPDQPWKFIPITPKAGYQQFTHGTGFGDINGDGRIDILEAEAWWEQPANPTPGQPWIKHPYHFADAAAQLLAYDVDGDGKNDILTAWHCHLYGIVWHRQIKNGQGEIAFEKHTIIGQKPEENPQGIRFSQAHAFDLADINGDGLTDFVVGKRWWAHGPNGDVEPGNPAVVYWFELKRDAAKGAQFIAHQIHDNSGVGTQVATADLNADGVPDIIVGNKKGTFISLSQPAQ